MDQIKQLYILATGIAKCEVIDLGGGCYRALGLRVDLPNGFRIVSSMSITQLAWREEFTHQQLMIAVDRQMETRAARDGLSGLPSA